MSEEEVKKTWELHEKTRQIQKTKEHIEELAMMKIRILERIADALEEIVGVFFDVSTSYWTCMGPYPLASCGDDEGRRCRHLLIALGAKSVVITCCLFLTNIKEIANL